MRTPFSLEGKTELLEGSEMEVDISEAKDKRTNPGTRHVFLFSFLAPICFALAWADFSLLASDESCRLTVS